MLLAFDRSLTRIYSQPAGSEGQAGMVHTMLGKRLGPVVSSSEVGWLE
jgi:hypothetical protein